MPQPKSRNIQALRPKNPGLGRAVSIARSPLRVAAGLQHLGGLVFLDTSCATPGARSLVTAAPQALLCGHMDRDWSVVETVLQQGQGGPGGLFGWVGFDGQFVFGHYPHVLSYDHAAQTWTECGGLSSALQDVAPGPAPQLDFQPQVSRADFMAAVQRAQDYIAAGDIYQVNLAHPWKAAWPDKADALGFYERLRAISPAPYAAYLELNDQRIFSSSPESFLHLRGRSIQTRPIKGTRPRFPQDAQRDQQALQELQASVKENAELLMITDLERNDLGQVCEFGSIHVSELAAVESFAQVFHLVSTVQGILRADISHAEAFRQCFPGGSISGAPKKRALEIIHELEPHPRGLYTGTIGYFGFNGESQFNIVIRTAVQAGREITFHAGAGIVADSVPALEYEETLHKAAGLLRAAM